jgi:high frequency lysogenization protein
MDALINDRTLALAGIFQAVQLVQRTARFGSPNGPSYEPCIKTIFDLDPDSTELVYGGVQGIGRGLKLLRDQLDNQSETRDIELTKYVVQLLHLEKQLSKDRRMQQRLREGILQITPLAERTSVTDAEVITRLADLYSNTISTLTPRILVSGEQEYLSNPTVANQIRALLLAGIRSAVLWRQRGGTRWKLVFERNKLVSTANELLLSSGAAAE